MASDLEQHASDEKKWFDRLPQWNGTVIQWRHIPQFLEQEIPQFHKSLINIIGAYVGGCPFEEFIGTNFRTTEFILCDYCDCRFKPGNKIAIFGGSRVGPEISYVYPHICNLCWPYETGKEKRLQNTGSNFIRWQQSRISSNTNNIQMFTFNLFYFNINIATPITFVEWCSIKS